MTEEERRASKPVRAYLALGSNLGDRMTHLRHAVARLAAHPEVKLLRLSPVVETPPMGPSDQGAFLNAVVATETTLEPKDLLALCRRIEEAGKRQRTIHWGPRTIDVDLVDVGGAIVETPTLRLPHPGMRERIFVLAPLADVAPGWKHPETGESVEELWGKMSVDEKRTLRVVAEAERWWPHAVRPGRCG